MSVIKAEFSPLGRVGAQPLVIEAAELRGLFEQIERLASEAEKLRAERDMLVALVHRSADDPNERKTKDGA